MLTAIRQWVIKTMMKGNTGVVQTLPKKEIIEMNVQITAERFMRNGINPNDMKTVGQVENVVNQIEQPKVNVNPGVTGVKKADVMDMEGNKLDPEKPILGGKQETSIDQESFLQRIKKAVDEDREIKARLDKSNEEGIASMKNKLDDPEEKADGGRIGLLAGSTKIPAMISALLKNKKKVNQAVNNIFPTGDYKLDAEMVAESIVELNPKTFDNMLYDDLNDVTRSEVYGAALSGVNQQNALMLQMKKATRPEKTLASMNEGKGINMSDPEIADEFARFMKETDPKGTKDIEEKILLESFDPKRTKGNADGGRIGLKKGSGGITSKIVNALGGKNMTAGELGIEGLNQIYQLLQMPGLYADGGRIGLKSGLGKRFLEFLKAKKTKPKGDTLYGVGGKEIDVNDLKKKYSLDKESLEKADKEFEIKLNEILAKDKNITKHADGGRIGYSKGNIVKGIISLFKKKPKKLENTVNEFIEKRKFLKSMVGETEKNKKARDLKMLKEAMEEARENPGFKFENVDVDKDIRPIFDKEIAESLKKNRKLNADGGRIGFKSGLGKAFIEFLKNTGKTMNDKNPIDLGKDYLKYIKDESIKGNSKKIAPGVLTIGGGGILANRFVGRRLEEMNKEQKMEMYEDTKKEFIEEYKNDPELLEIMLKNLDDRTFGKIEEKADGGRIGLKAGMTKRAFMKLMGSTAAGIGAVKSGIFSGFGKGAGKTVAKEVAQQTTSSMPPPYFFKLAEKIKNMGTDVTATTERTIAKSLKSKDGNAEYILEQDMVSGDTLIKKVNKEGDDMITDVQIMEYRIGENVKTRDGRVVTSPNEYEEVTEVNKRIYKDDYNASDYTDGIEEIELKKIIDEVDDQAPSIKYASGGLAYMLGE